MSFKYDEETVEEGQERFRLEMQYERLFGERLAGTINFCLPQPWTSEYRDLIRACVEAESQAPMVEYLKSIGSDQEGPVVIH